MKVKFLNFHIVTSASEMQTLLISLMMMILREIWSIFTEFFSFWKSRRKSFVKTLSCKVFVFPKKWVRKCFVDFHVSTHNDFEFWVSKLKPQLYFTLFHFKKVEVRIVFLGFQVGVSLETYFKRPSDAE